MMWVIRWPYVVALSAMDNMDFMDNMDRMDWFR
jgi:hypothetical protein